MPDDDALRQMTWELSLAYEALTAVYAMTQRLATRQDEADIWMALRDSLARVLTVGAGRILVATDAAWVEAHHWGDAAVLADPQGLVAALQGRIRGRPSLRLNDPTVVGMFQGLQPGRRNLLAIPVEGTQRVEAWVLLLDRRDEGGPKPFTTGDQKLAATLAQQAGFALVSRRAAQEEVRLARIDRELEIARDIQQNLLQPNVLAVSGWEVALESCPAYEVSGDYCGFEPTLGADGAGILLTDVMGKGVPAALHAATARAVLMALGAPQDPQLLMGRLERVLRPDLSRMDSFMALTYISFAPDTGRVCLLNAGNPPVFLRRQDGTVVTLPSSGSPLGWPGRPAQVVPVELSSGDALVLSSDGLFDQVDPAGQAFGEERVIDVLRGGEESADGLLARILTAVRDHQRGRAALDDMTLAVLRRAS